MTDFAAILEYYPLPLAAKHPDCEETELLLLAHAGMITFYQYPDPTNLIEWEQVNIMEIGAVSSCKTAMESVNPCTGKRTGRARSGLFRHSGSGAETLPSVDRVDGYRLAGSSRA